MAACYDFRLECDGEDCTAGPYGDRRVMELTDEFGSKCRAVAKRRGWWFNVKTGLCLCPSCHARGAQVAP